VTRALSIDVPHYASLREGQREIVIWSSFDGEKWTPHTSFSTTTTTAANSGTVSLTVDEDSDLLDASAGSTLDGGSHARINYVISDVGLNKLKTSSTYFTSFCAEVR